MGVKGLWSVLEPSKELCSWDSLHGLTLAVDVSGWIKESDQAGFQLKRKPHLKIIYDRVKQLLRCHANLVFVFDGLPPLLKRQVMEKRGKGQCYDPGYSYNSTAIQECHSFLKALGIPFLDSEGEAEATCALLNEKKIVDGVITNDSDAFLFGAQKVFVNFSGNANKVHQLQYYTMHNIEKELGLTRNHLIAYALLVGCDYCVGGVSNVGMNKAIGLIRSIRDNPLQRLKSWREGMEEFKKICGKTDHFNNYKAELKIRESSLKDPDFPKQEVIDAFLSPGITSPQNVDVQWRKPNVDALLTYRLSANPLNDLAPLLVSYSMISEKDASCVFFSNPKIVRKRKKNHQDVFEVEWKLSETCDGATVLDVKKKFGMTLDNPVTTFEYSAIFSSCFPDLVKQFDASSSKKSTSKRKRGLVDATCTDKQRPITDYFKVKKRKSE